MERGACSESGGPAAELGTIRYVNLTADSEHGNYLPAVEEARKTKKPLFANFVQWPGWQGCKDAGRIFSDPIIKRAAEELFVPCVFNTWDRSDSELNQAMHKWGGGLTSSWWGYLRIIDPEGKILVSGTGQLTSYNQLQQVKQVMQESLVDLGEVLPDYFDD